MRAGRHVTGTQYDIQPCHLSYVYPHFAISEGQESISFHLELVAPHRQTGKFKVPLIIGCGSTHQGSVAASDYDKGADHWVMRRVNHIPFHVCGALRLSQTSREN